MADFVPPDDDELASADQRVERAGPRRPITVTLAVALMALQVPVYAVGLLVGADNQAVLRQALRSFPAERADSIQYLGILPMAVAAALVLGIGVVFGVLAAFTLQGNSVGRALTLAGCFV